MYAFYLKPSISLTLASVTAQARSVSSFYLHSLHFVITYKQQIAATNGILPLAETRHSQREKKKSGKKPINFPHQTPPTIGREEKRNIFYLIKKSQFKSKISQQLPQVEVVKIKLLKKGYILIRV